MQMRITLMDLVGLVSYIKFLKDFRHIEILLHIDEFMC